MRGSPLALPYCQGSNITWTQPSFSSLKILFAWGASVRGSLCVMTGTPARNARKPGRNTTELLQWLKVRQSHIMRSTPKGGARLGIHMQPLSMQLT